VTVKFECASRAKRRALVLALLALLPWLFACEDQPVALELELDAGEPHVDAHFVGTAAMAQSVAAPDYALDTTGLMIVTDAHDVVQAATGSAALSSGAVVGQRYVVVDAAALTTYAALDKAFISAAGAALTPAIPAAAFALVGADLTTPQARTLILANIETGVASYQSFEVTFEARNYPPSR
jgi:hypothetical protein